MKTKNFFASGMFGLSAFLFASAVVMTFCTILTFNENNRWEKQQGNVDAKSSYSVNLANPSQVISKEISKLEKERATLSNKLEKAKADRNKDNGMVAGLYYQPLEDLTEIINLEGKISKLDHKIAALKNKEKSIAANNGCDIQRLALR